MLTWAQPRAAEGWHWLPRLVLLPKSSLECFAFQGKLHEVLWGAFCGICEVPVPFVLALCGSVSQPGVWFSHRCNGLCTTSFPSPTGRKSTSGISNPWYLKNQENWDYSNKGLYLCTARMFTSHPHTLLTKSSPMFSSIISSLEFLNAFSNVKKVLMHAKQLTALCLHKQPFSLITNVSFILHSWASTSQGCWMKDQLLFCRMRTSVKRWI